MEYQEFCGILGILLPNKQHFIPQRIKDNPDNCEIIKMPTNTYELELAIELAYNKRYNAPNLSRPLRKRNSYIQNEVEYEQRM